MFLLYNFVTPSDGGTRLVECRLLIVKKLAHYFRLFFVRGIFRRMHLPSDHLQSFVNRNGEKGPTVEVSSSFNINEQGLVNRLH